MFFASGTPVLPLLTTVFTSILEVFLLCLAGYILAWRGVVDKRIQKGLNRLNVSLLTPALLFSKVAFFLSPAKLRELWIIPIFFVLVTGLSGVVAYILGRVFRLKKSQRNFAMAASMFMNSNSLPIALMQSLVVTVPGLKWDENDNKDIMLGRALTYLVLYSTLGMMLRWSYGVRLLATQDEPTSPLEPHETSPLLSDSEDMFHPSSREHEILHHRHTEPATPGPIRDDASSGSTVNGDTDRYKLKGRLARDGGLAPIPTNAIYHSFPNSPAQHIASLPAETPSQPSSADISDDDGDVLVPRFCRRFATPASIGLQSFIRRSRSRIARGWRTVNDFMTVPLWASILSLIVACVRPLQHALDEHMQPVKGSLNSAGNCSIPLTLVVLGAYFYTPPEDRPASRTRGLSSMDSVSSLFSQFQAMFQLKHTRRTSRHRSGSLLSASSERSRPGETRTVIVAVLSRMILVPVLFLPLMALSTAYDLNAVFDDPVFVVSSVLLIGSPPALTLAQITQAASNDAFERLISRTIFWSYCIVTPPTTIIYVVVGLVLAKR
ncbi:hypothetical protein BV22DRAFT_192046 [Leucogyrophana mollusca]|uniref:Uncharacterized protein n=1 Tax=Leucogyrophana mollusca TaxID=85980 RepID=A0ACB8BSG3_9AGAM|nr:hypothetical protein BV22DRAFT_192046 [Leucogyrophana mollusca]